MIDFDDIACVLVTRGDQDLDEIIDSLPFTEIVIWDNSKRPFNAKVLGRYLGIWETNRPVIAVQDDDCIVHCWDELRHHYEPGRIVANMPVDHRVGEPPMLGWGALFDRDLPWGAFQRWCAAGHEIDDLFVGYPETIFTALTPCTRINRGSYSRPGSLAHTDLPWSSAPSRSHNQPGHVPEFAHVLKEALALVGGHAAVREFYADGNDLYTKELKERLAKINRYSAAA